MNAKTKKILFILSACAVAVVLAAFIFVLFFDINSYKPGIEAAASEASGMDVRINGKMKLTLFPLASVSLEDILIQNRGVDVASAKEAKVGITLLPLLRQKLIIRQVRVITPTFYITKNKRGVFNFETPEKKPVRKKFPAIENISVKSGNVLYADEKSGEKIEVNDCDLAIKDFSAGGEVFIKALYLEGDLSCKEAKAKGLSIADIRVAMKARRGEFEATPITMKIFGGDGKGSIKGVMTGNIPEYLVDFTITKFRFEEVLGSFRQKKSIRGKMDLIAHISMKGKNSAEMKSAAQGEISLRGESLFHESLDFDRLLEKYEKSQSFNLIDVGAFFVAGPLGTLVTKGYDFGRVYEESLGGKGTIEKLVSDWKVRNGVAEATDVAFVTKKNRVALKGKLDFVRNRFENVSIAVLNAKGCATYSQRIHGDFKKPQIDKPSIFSSLVAPISSLLKKPVDIITGGRCEAFYIGSLKHP